MILFLYIYYLNKSHVRQPFLVLLNSKVYDQHAFEFIPSKIQFRFCKLILENLTPFLYFTLCTFHTKSTILHLHFQYWKFKHKNNRNEDIMNIIKKNPIFHHCINPDIFNQVNPTQLNILDVTKNVLKSFNECLILLLILLKILPYLLKIIVTAKNISF